MGSQQIASPAAARNQTSMTKSLPRPFDLDDSTHPTGVWNNRYQQDLSEKFEKQRRADECCSAASTTVDSRTPSLDDNFSDMSDSDGDRTDNKSAVRHEALRCSTATYDDELNEL